MKYMNPVIPSLDLAKSLRFWTKGLGFKIIDEIRRDENLVWCMLSGFGFYVQLHHRIGIDDTPENYEGIRIYWEPENLDDLHSNLVSLGFRPSEIVLREYGRREFSLTDTDQFHHCFGVESEQAEPDGI